jgi:hypothetical protein
MRRLAGVFTLTTALIFLIVAIEPAGAAHADPVCSADQVRLGTCLSGPPKASIGGHDVELSDAVNRGGGPTGGRVPGSGSARKPTAAEERRAREQAGGRPEFWVVYTPPPEAPVVTISDIASFRPAVGGNHTEPNGWTVVGLHTNFYSDAGSHVVDGTLLGAAASVRFTPTTWTWDFGDGTSLISKWPGASWAALGVGEFEQTATSHVYATATTATIRLTIDFSAEYRIGAGEWTPIAGSLPVQAPPMTIIAGGAKTVLVGHDCGSNPRGPGC